MPPIAIKIFGGRVKGAAFRSESGSRQTGRIRRRRSCRVYTVLLAASAHFAIGSTCANSAAKILTYLLVIPAWQNLPLVLGELIAMVPRTSRNHAGPICANSAAKIQMFLLAIPVWPKRIIILGLKTAMVQIPPKARNVGPAVEALMTRGNAKMAPPGGFVRGRLSKSPPVLSAAAK